MSSVAGLSSISSPNYRAHSAALGSSRAAGGADFGGILNSRLQATEQASSPAAADLQLLQALSQGSNLIGKTVTYSKNGGETTAKGVVQSLRVENGKIHIVVGGNSIPLDRVRSLSS